MWLLRLDGCYTGGTAPSCLAVDNQPWLARSGSPLVRGLGRFASRYKVCVLFSSCSRAGFGLVLGRFWGSWSLSHPACGPVARQAPCLEGEAWWFPLTELSWLPYNSAFVQRVVMVALRARLLCSPIFPGTFPKFIYLNENNGYIYTKPLRLQSHLVLLKVFPQANLAHFWHHIVS